MNSTIEQLLSAAVEQQLAGNTEAASGLYNRVLATNPNNIAALVNKSAILIEHQNYIDATQGKTNIKCFKKTPTTITKYHNRALKLKNKVNFLKIEKL